MALNKFMHPRNIYRTPPDFCKLFKEFEEFSNIAKMDVSGKVSIDFKDPQALRILTKCLLKSDFGLDVIIPEDRLVPTLPLRLNYILWIEDLMTSIHREDSITGLDIGTGACAIYPLLSAVKNKWYMVGTEKDEQSLQKAVDNVTRNNLQHLIKLRNNTSASLIEHLFLDDDGLRVDFCMCNPPFYSSFQDLYESRSPARPPPKNAFTGSPQELITEGGELEFCRKLIKESEAFKNNILIFTTMIGHKYNLKELILDLKAKGIRHTTTEFCQGRVTRWGLAWTYQDFDIYNLVPPREKSRKKNVPVSFVLPELSKQCHNIENISEKIKTMFDRLEIQHKLITKRRNEIILNFTALRNNWSNQRRKRRFLKRTEEDEPKAQKVKQLDVTNEKCIEIDSVSCDQTKDEEQKSLLNETIINTENNIATCSLVLNDNSKQNKNDNENPLVQGIIKISNKVNQIVLDMEYIEGSAGKEGIHQILQYIKNNLK
ncbi:unnamed protein product [Parnassius mnemosyne]|uniref:U6 small nuclear RNA (adenine-(43)-N(6))-methyltransferase n=1 Tax=Parnassius mnemosyne TaxID=213953 RepID=A0AAV1KBE9_9NEOP